MVCDGWWVVQLVSYESEVDIMVVHVVCTSIMYIYYVRVHVHHNASKYMVTTHLLFTHNTHTPHTLHAHTPNTDQPPQHPQAMGIQRYIFFSIHDCDKFPEVPLMSIKNATEKYLETSGLNYTVFRLCGFMQVC